MEKMGAALLTRAAPQGGLGRDAENVPGDAAFDVEAATVRFDKSASPATRRQPRAPS